MNLYTQSYYKLKIDLRIGLPLCWRGVIGVIGEFGELSSVRVKL